MTTTAAQTALVDQLTAAASDAARTQARIARHAGLPIRHAPACHPWLTEQIRALLAALTGGTARLCRHIGASPLVLHGAAWAPGHLVCSACVADLHPGPAEDNICDRCRRTADPIHPGMAQTGPLLLSYGLCHRCARQTGLGHPTPPGADSSTPASR